MTTTTDGWLYLEHPDTGGSTRIPNDPAVLAAQEARGWRVADEPAPEPGLPPKVNLDPDAPDGEWVTLVHPLLGRSHAFPNTPAALAGATDAGWVQPNSDGSTPKPAQRKAAKDAGVDVADLPPVDAPVTDDLAAGAAGAQEQPDQPADSSATDKKE